MTQSPVWSPAALKTQLVLMFKAPARSKRRIAAEVGYPADGIAGLLLDCAAEDLAQWPGPACYAPASPADAAWLHDSHLPHRPLWLQGDGNLGQRIERVGNALRREEPRPQLFIGIDCPELTPDYLNAAAVALEHDAFVLGPADDGGVVVMGTAAAWPPLDDLPWSEPSLCNRLQAACLAVGRGCRLLPPLSDVDSIDDLERVVPRLSGDDRSSRLALCQFRNDRGGGTVKHA